MKKLYKKVKENQGAVVARELVKQILESYNGNVSKTASILGCSRKCIRRARDDIAKDKSRAPKSKLHLKSTPIDLENLVLLERKKNIEE